MQALDRIPYHAVPPHCVRIIGTGKDRRLLFANTIESQAWLREIKQIYRAEQRELSTKKQRPGSELDGEMICLWALIKQLEKFDPIDLITLGTQLENRHSPLHQASFPTACKVIFGKILKQR